ncbi:hypothetical protein AYO22_11377 [Fonsecaea multimorphosa]|nr:hypothetical protein AYO22_11377 [Fonsecaea multimorphosa]
MGCGASKEDTAGKARNDEIDNQLKRDKMAQRNEIKMLLLGAGESGKSTILKQMKLIHEGGYSRDERESFKEIIYSNTVQSMRVILEAMESLELPLDDQRAEYHVQTIFMQPPQIEGDSLPPEVGAAIKALWQDAGVQECFKRSREYQLNDSARYYFDSIDRIAAHDYLPNDQDVLRSRVKTTGITETTFIIQDLTYRMFDVGGQRSERKKWIHCFENVTTILFLVAISEYDQLLFEDETVNRMQEALTLFDSICNSRWFIKTSIILFLNKIDRFKEKLPVSPMQNYFPDYEGGPDYAAACDYILNRFVSLNQAETKQIYTHFTCATDTTQIRFVMGAVNDIIIQENLRIFDLPTTCIYHRRYQEGDGSTDYFFDQNLAKSLPIPHFQLKVRLTFEFHISPFRDEQILLPDPAPAKDDGVLGDWGPQFFFAVFQQSGFYAGRMHHFPVLMNHVRRTFQGARESNSFSPYQLETFRSSDGRPDDRTTKGY